MVLSNLDYLDLGYLDFPIIQTCFFGPSFCMNVN